VQSILTRRREKEREREGGGREREERRKRLSRLLITHGFYLNKK